MSIKIMAIPTAILNYSHVSNLHRKLDSINS